jgi:hypothetical protein
MSDNRIHNADKGIRNSNPLSFIEHTDPQPVPDKSPLHCSGFFEQDGIFYCAPPRFEDNKGRPAVPVPLKSGDKRPSIGDSPLVSSLQPRQKFIDNPGTLVSGV